MTNTCEEDKKREAGALSGWNAATQKTGIFRLTSSGTFHNGSGSMRLKLETQIQEQHEELLTILSFDLCFRNIPSCGLGSYCPFFAAKGVEDN